MFREPTCRYFGTVESYVRITKGMLKFENGTWLSALQVMICKKSADPWCSSPKN
jgi:hypothetical protein